VWNNFSPFKIRVNVDACTTLRVAGDRDFFIIDVLYDGEGNKNTLLTPVLMLHGLNIDFLIACLETRVNLCF
jgi:hypothetical protein